MHTHEWVNDDHNSRRDAMENGTLRCEHCGTGVADKLTFERLPGKYYAGRYSAPGYLDCTDWIYNCNLRKLKRELRELYGSAD